MQLQVLVLLYVQLPIHKYPLWQLRLGILPSTRLFRATLRRDALMREDVWGRAVGDGDGVVALWLHSAVVKASA